MLQTGERLCLPMLQEVLDLALLAAGDLWPTQAMALGRLFERGAAFLHGGSQFPQVTGRAPQEILDALNATREDLFLVEALYLLTRHVAYTLTREGAAREATWVRLADRHLEIRAEIVERRREEEGLKRRLQALGGEVTALPEHEDLPPAPAGRARKSEGMFTGLFEGAALVEPELDVDGPTLEMADRAAESHGWDGEWGEHARLLVLTYGMSLSLREREADALNPDDGEALDAAQKIARARLAGLEGRYATLRRRLFELRHNNRILGWRITALEVEAQGMRSRLDQFLLDRDRLESAIAEREAAGIKPRSESDPAGDGVSGGWLGKLGRLFGIGGS
ncbi:MAG: hypothetical protein IT306_14085 [Chloroflexi bacterium]|nr:hypothetical protein [Chloroflexota bacterium]